MNTTPKAPGGLAMGLVMGLLALMIQAPQLIEVISALVPLVLLVGIVSVIVRLIFFYTRRNW